MYYRRYFDDSFLLFKNEDQITPFQNYLNDNRSDIKFSDLFLVNYIIQAATELVRPVFV